VKALIVHWSPEMATWKPCGHLPWYCLSLTTGISEQVHTNRICHIFASSTSNLTVISNSLGIISAGFTSPESCVSVSAWSSPKPRTPLLPQNRSTQTTPHCSAIARPRWDYEAFGGNVKVLGMVWHWVNEVVNHMVVETSTKR
jgi:hypothetical protein